MPTFSSLIAVVGRWFQELRECFNWHFWYMVFSLLISTYLFLLNPALIESFGEEWLYAYLEFSRTIYYPQTNFYAESVLFPWMSFLLGASKHWLFYKILCSFLTLLILPTIAYFASKYFDTPWHSWIFILLFVISYRYLWRTYYLGYPDHITIIFLAAMALQRKPIAAFVFAALATVSHFSIALISIGGFVLLMLTSRGIPKVSRLAFAQYTLAGLITGRLLLEIWYYRFNYQLKSRFHWAAEHGLDAFVTRYEEDVLGFWLTPGIAFLAIFAAIVAWSIYQRCILSAAAMASSLVLGYVALFLTVDGLRVFAVIISAPYVFILRGIVEALLNHPSTDRTKSSD
jgi:hypothetical protein